MTRELTQMGVPSSIPCFYSLFLVHKNLYPPIACCTAGSEFTSDCVLTICRAGRHEGSHPVYSFGNASSTAWVRDVG